MVFGSNNIVIKYQNNISNKFPKISNNNTNDVKITFKTYNNLIKHIKNKK
jgi:hypothetical protein